MNNFIRELYNSEICEVSRYHNLSMKGKAAANKQENIYNKLSSSLEKTTSICWKNILTQALSSEAKSFSTHM